MKSYQTLYQKLQVLRVIIRDLYLGIAKYKFVTTLSNPAYLVVPISRRISEFTNLQAWKFFKDKNIGVSQRDHFTNRIRSIENHISQTVSKYNSKIS